MFLKQKRHFKILEIIKEKAIETQEELAKELRKEGFNVTQATVSRDIKELRLIKLHETTNNIVMQSLKELHFLQIDY